jgi:phosphoheptose isomerase
MTAQSATTASPAVDHLDALRAALDAFKPDLPVIERWGRELVGRLTAGGRLLTIGNGGSAAHAEHLAAEFVGRYRDERAPFSAVALHAEGATLSALVNDYGPAEMFARQVRAHARRGDVLVAFSTSGRSPNVLSAARAARQLDATVWSFTGPAPNLLADESTEAVAVDAQGTPTIQEVHQVALHLLCEGFDKHFRKIGEGGIVVPKLQLGRGEPLAR